MNHSTKWLVGLSAIAFPSAFIILMLQIILIIAPMSWWIEYESVEPLSDKILTGTKPRFISTLVVRRACDLKYNDVVFCRQDGVEKYTYTHQYPSASYGKQVGKEQNEWVYGHKVWNVSKCYLKANIILQLPFSVTKTQTVISDPFSVVNEIK